MRQVQGAPGRRRRRRLPWVLLALVALVVLELAVIIAVGRQVGVLWTLLALVLMSVLGLWLLRREGARAWRALRETARSGEMPSRQIADGILVLVGGVLLMLPGFVTDAVGILLVLPVTRPLARPVLEAAIGRRVFHDLGVVHVTRTGPPPRTPGPRRTQRPPDVVEGEIIE
ncbi:FxsA family protein [Janibacter endophyticus]|uniref:FxsA family protein n=1 Tax=Janibacter endophyticus TaxID=2806261 RepID=UPI0027DC6158|nr:FxsA family protein [Janibacter endophyticus]